MTNTTVALMIIVFIAGYLFRIWFKEKATKNTSKRRLVMAIRAKLGKQDVGYGFKAFDDQGVEREVQSSNWTKLGDPDNTIADFEVSGDAKACKYIGKMPGFVTAHLDVDVDLGEGVVTLSGDSEIEFYEEIPMATSIQMTPTLIDK